VIYLPEIEWLVTSSLFGTSNYFLLKKKLVNCQSRNARSLLSFFALKTATFSRPPLGGKRILTCPREMLRPLLRGATVVCIPDEASYDPVALIDLLARWHVTETLMTPTLLAAVLSRHSDIQADIPDLRTLWLNVR
jgi:non-ribosomal peptide synthetase component F